MWWKRVLQMVKNLQLLLAENCGDKPNNPM